MALNPGPGVEGNVVAEGDEVFLRHLCAVIEEPPANLDTQHLQDRALERRAIEERTHLSFELEEAFRPPEVNVVYRAVLGLQGFKSRGCALNDCAVEQTEQ